MDSALVVDDRGASYPILIDPIASSVEQIVDAGGALFTTAEFGDAVAIDGNNAIVGAWREDLPPNDNRGGGYLFTRTGSSWSSVAGRVGVRDNQGWGDSVPTWAGKTAWGGPGASRNTGPALVFALGPKP